MGKPEIFTKEWIELIDKKVCEEFGDFEWEGNVPKTPLNIIYEIVAEAKTVIFVYHIECSPDEIHILLGAPNDKSNVANITYRQTKEVALGIMEGKLDSHIEFLMGNIEIQGDVRELEPYSEIIPLISSAIGGSH